MPPEPPPAALLPCRCAGLPGGAGGAGPAPRIPPSSANQEPLCFCFVSAPCCVRQTAPCSLWVAGELSFAPQPLSSSVIDHPLPSLFTHTLYLSHSLIPPTIQLSSLSFLPHSSCLLPHSSPSPVVFSLILPTLVLFSLIPPTL